MIETDDPVLVVTLDVKNISEGRVFRSLIYSGKVEDSFGNKMPRSFDDFTIYLIEDCKSREGLQPGETAVIRDMRQLRPAKVEWHRDELFGRFSAACWACGRAFRICLPISGVWCESRTVRGTVRASTQNRCRITRTCSALPWFQ